MIRELLIKSIVFERDRKPHLAGFFKANYAAPVSLFVQ